MVLNGRVDNGVVEDLLLGEVDIKLLVVLWIDFIFSKVNICFLFSLCIEKVDSVESYECVFDLFM